MLTTPPQIVHVGACALKHDFDRGWPFAADNAEAIARHWQTVLGRHPNYFNGTVHLMTRCAIRDDGLSGDLIATSFSSFLYWRDHGYPDTSVFDCFGSALLRARDGSIILGRQSAGHINAGLTYLPGGFIDERDVSRDGTVNISASVAREIAEEMGYAIGAFAVRPGLYVTRVGQQLSLAIEHVSDLDAATLLGQARAFIAAEAAPELDDVVAVSRRADLTDLAMPAFARALVEHLLR